MKLEIFNANCRNLMNASSMKEDAAEAITSKKQLR
jgi:hypothetical protein